MNNTKRRDSNMELYRIVAMLLVMLFHVCGEIDQIGDRLFPDTLETTHMVNLFFTSATFVCVDMFVLLSGWYGINLKWKKIQSLVFQVLFYSVLLYVVMMLVFPNISFSPRFLIHVVIMDDYWFIPVYLMLCLVAPALNPFIKQANHKLLLTVVLAIITMQSIYGWIDTRESGYMEGCSPISFIILYMLGAYLHRFETKFRHISSGRLLSFYFILISVNWGIAVIAKQYHSITLLQIAWQFSSPLIILASACLLLVFSRIDIGYNRVINWIAASSFAAFLIHCFPLFYDNVYATTVTNIYSELPLYISIPALIAFVLTVYAASILIDQIRIKIYRFVKGNN